MTILEKRTEDDRLYDLACGNLMQPGETITGINSVGDDQNLLTFGAAVTNPTEATYPSLGNLTVPAMTVIQVRISGGVLPAWADSFICTVRAVFTTSLGNTIEATVLILLKNDIIPDYCVGC